MVLNEKDADPDQTDFEHFECSALMKIRIHV